MVLIGFVAGSLCGKTVSANYLCEKFGFSKLSIGDEIKKCVKELFDLSDEQLYGNTKDIVDERFGTTPRELTQFVGTDTFINNISVRFPTIGNSFWADKAEKKLLNMKNCNVVIDDVRYQCDASMIKKHGGYLIKIIRPNHPQRSHHASENSWCNIETDYTIDNDQFDREKLYKNIDDIVKLITKKIPLGIVMTYRCNYNCKFCIHPPHNSVPYDLPINYELESVLNKLYKSYMFNKVTINGGEPFTRKQELSQLLHMCKKIGFITTIITNASLFDPDWIIENKDQLDMIGFSLDTMDDELNVQLSRCVALKIPNASKLVKQAIEYCQNLNIKFKINTLVTKTNYKDTSVGRYIAGLSKMPIRWKIGKCYNPVMAKDSAKDYVPSDEEFQYFIDNNQQLIDDINNKTKNKCAVVENKTETQDSYMTLLPNLCFEKLHGTQFSCTSPLTEIDVQTAVRDAGFDEEHSRKRNADYFK